MREKVLERGGCIISSGEIHIVDNWDFYFPLYVGIILFVISIILAIIMKKHWCLILFMGTILMALTMPLSLYESINNMEVAGTEYVFTLNSGKSLSPMYEVFDKIEPYGGSRYVGYKYYYDYMYLKDQSDPFK